MRHVLFLAVLILGTTSAIAQSDQNQTSPTAQTTAPQGNMSSANSGGNTSVVGCLSGSDGNYVLTAKDGTTFQLTGDTAKLSEHVGHEIKVTGSKSASAMSPGGETESGASKETLQVSSFKHISKTCSSGGGMSH
jgi:Protein of unknown function (DUF5818)